MHPTAPIGIGNADRDDVVESGCSARAASTSAAKTLAPPDTIMSVRRSAMKR